MHVGAYRGKEDGIGSYAAVVTGDCERSQIGAGN